MGIIVTKDENEKSELTQRIKADLAERNRRTSKQEGKRKDPDFVEDSNYTKGMKKTGRFTWMWFVLVGLALISVVIIAVG